MGRGSILRNVNAGSIDGMTHELGRMFDIVRPLNEEELERERVFKFTEYQNYGLKYLVDILGPCKGRVWEDIEYRMCARFDGIGVARIDRKGNIFLDDQSKEEFLSYLQLHKRSFM